MGKAWTVYRFKGWRVFGKKEVFLTRFDTQMYTIKLAITLTVLLIY